MYTPKQANTTVELHYKFYEVVLGVQGNEVTGLPFAVKWTFQTIILPPSFTTALTQQTISVDGISFGTTIITLPSIIDPSGLAQKPTVITNLADYNYLSFDNVNKVTVDPALVNNTSWNTTISLNIKLENVAGTFDTYIQQVLVNLICAYSTSMSLDSSK
jgi:hypothetical protein